jgi:hypothetical protein
MRKKIKEHFISILCNRKKTKESQEDLWKKNGNSKDK